jgi:mannosyltransferase OCH1-like enzyme
MKFIIRILFLVEYLHHVVLSTTTPLLQFPNDHLIFKNPDIQNKPKQPIPQTIWMTMKRFPETPAKHIETFKQLNPTFKFQFINDSEMMSMMETEFKDTSLLWALKQINPKIGAAKADIWRMATLWRYGGCYIDYDSYFRQPLASLINFEKDEMILSTEEQNWFNNFYHSSVSFSVPDPDKYFNHRLVIQWALCSRPYHPFLQRFLSNVAQSIQFLYHQNPHFLLEEKFPEKWFTILYATGPGLWTASIIEELKKNPSTQHSYRLIDPDFKPFGGVFKAVDNHDKFHYFSTLKHSHLFLKSYASNNTNTETKNG